MCCPLSRLESLAYAKQYYPEEYERLMDLAAQTEKELEERRGRPVSMWDGNPKYNTEYKRARIEKYISNKEFEKNQITLF